MNSYHIVYIGADGEPEDTQVIERTEAAARKTFRQSHKANDIMSVEIAEENVPATKDQEREALAKIKQMVEELGPQSYVGTAFEGCFEDAESNIENDFAFSMKARVEDAEEKLREMGSDLVSAKADAAHLKEQLTAAQEERSALERKLAGQSLPEWLRFELHAFATEQEIAAHKSMDIAAEDMAATADHPQDIAFEGAVNFYRKAKEQRERCAKILSGLNEIHPEDQ